MKTKSKSKSGIKIGIAATAALVIVIAVLAAFSSPVSAQGDPGAGCPSTTQFYDTIKGGIYFEQQGWMKSSPFEVTFDNVPSGIKVARVYTGVWGGSPSKGGEFNITVNGVTSPTYQACDPCPQPQNCSGWQHLRCDTVNETECHDYVTGCNVHFISYNATSDIKSGSNTIKVMDGCTGGCTCWDSRIYLIALLVVYEDTSMPNMTYWINEGQPYMEKGSACDGSDDHLNASIYFNGSYTTPSSRVRYWTLGWPHVFNASVSPAYTNLNGVNIGYPDHTEEHGGYEVLLRWDNIPTTSLTNSNLLKYYDDAPYYERAGAAVFVVQGAITKPNLVADDIIFPDTLRPDKTHTIKAKITNMGVNAGSFNVTLYANGTSSTNSYTENVVSLPAGQSTIVDFSSVTLPYDCYEFKVVADSDGDITEFNENDNTRKENYQVGYYIVVKSNDDFETLLSDTGLPANSVTKDVSGTYYIQNLTVENCFGRGIDIENTDVQFVINNCTIQNCEYGGVYLHSVTNGKVTDSVAQNNALKGIKVVYSTYVTIANNTVQNNVEYGIDVYPGLMPYSQLSEYITIKNNTVTGNLYGIELIGRHCTVCDNNISSNTPAIPGSDTGHGIRGYGAHHKIYNNTIAYNANYGIYMDYNAANNYCFENCIYGNTLTGNNVQFPGHTSQGYDSGEYNSWNSTVKLGYYYGGTGASYANDSYIGNNWSDYTGVDGNNDGIGNTWYAIDDISPVQHAPSENDTAPLMQPWTDYERILCGDVDASGEGVIKYFDIFKLKKHYNDPSYALASEWAGDVDCSGAIKYFDVFKLKKHYNDPSYELYCCTGCAS